MANSSRNCYFPSGVIAETNVPCSGEEYTSCCDHTDICLSNGLCLSAGQQPYTLSRGSCTNQKWDQGCPEYCGDVNPEGGCSIVNFSFINGVSRYCCGTAIIDGTQLACRDGEDFTVLTGEVLTGYALLQNITSLNAADSPTESSTESNSTSSSNCPTCSPCINTSDCNETTVGVGVGVPLGVIALATVGWALWERRRRKRAPVVPVTGSSPDELKPPAGYDGGVFAPERKPTRMSELDSPRPAVELNA
ncbi:hypothetical protein BJY01DRAFT_135727 [Aspergillus pseudoustus]|uniref:Mid2 domain-containing protein n=1 Tax=Aspergillus pseudoustus TaxID=1810923 RepID=A0ABR4IIS9_9EURO